jgi:2-polyprenyl-6-methoxyphenol hydroxylase-like FAD-dependent oxidoreductase
MKPDTEFLILGGGIAGLATAIALQKMGKQTLVAEAAESLRPVGAGIALAANAIKALTKLGVAENVIPRGRRLNDFSIYDEKGKLISKTHADNPEYGNFTIHRADLHAVLLSSLKPEILLTGKRTTRFEIDSSVHTVFFEDGTSLSASSLIVAEGVHSPIRRQLIPDSSPRFAGYTCWRGIADNATLRLEETSESWGRKGRFGVVPLNHDQIYWFACVNAPHPNSNKKHFTKKDLEEVFGGFHGPIPEVLSTTQADRILWNDIYDLRPLSHFAFGNVLLVGDAAHATTPNMGQGACMALEDAAILMACLKNQKTSAAFLDFEKRRLSRTREIVQQSWILGKIAQTENRWAIWLRNSAFSAMPASINKRQLEKLYQVDLD